MRYIANNVYDLWGGLNKSEIFECKYTVHACMHNITIFFTYAFGQYRQELMLLWLLLPFIGYTVYFMFRIYISLIDSRA